MMDTETWGEMGSKVFRSIAENVFKIFQRNFVNKRKPTETGMKPTDFLAQRQKNKDFKPAAAFTRQYELLDNELHEELLKNNSTVNVEKNLQHFYINPKYQGETFKILPHRELTIKDAVIFEPRSLNTPSEPMRMTVYIKTDKSILQTIETTGWATTALFDIEDKKKIVRLPLN